VDNTKQVYCDGSTNVWDDGYPSGGNYWSDHVTVDDYCGFNQDEPGSDGIVDEPYIINYCTRDNYPLVEPWSPVISATINIDPDTLNLRSVGEWITCYIELQKARPPSPVTVLVDMPDGYIPEKPVGTKFWVNFTINADDLEYNGPGGMIWWKLLVTVNPEILKPFMVKTTIPGYFLYDFADLNFYDYPKSIYGIDETVGLVEVTEMYFAPLPPGGAATHPDYLPTPYLLVSIAYEVVGPGITKIDIIDNAYTVLSAPTTKISMEEVDGWYGQPPVYQGYNVSDIDVSTVMLNGTIPVSLLDVPAPEPVPTEIGDYDSDGIPDLMVKFNRTELTSYIYHVLGIKYGNITLIITGNLTDGTMFEGSDTIRVNFAGDIDGDWDVDPFDYTNFRVAFGSKGPPQVPEPDPNYNPEADFDRYGNVDPFDYSTFRLNYGAHIPPPP